MIDYNIGKSQSFVGGDSEMRENYIQLLEDNNRLSKVNKQLEFELVRQPVK